MILALRTDKPEAEIYLHDGRDVVSSHSWAAHRQLSVQLIYEINELLNANDISKSDLSGIAVFKGPGSFTGLRIGISVANAMADGLELPIVSKKGEDWLSLAVAGIQAGENENIALPEYGGEANITKPRK